MKNFEEKIIPGIILPNYNDFMIFEDKCKKFEQNILTALISKDINKRLEVMPQIAHMCKYYINIITLYKNTLRMKELSYGFVNYFIKILTQETSKDFIKKQNKEFSASVKEVLNLLEKTQEAIVSLPKIEDQAQEINSVRELIKELFVASKDEESDA